MGWVSTNRFIEIPMHNHSSFFMHLRWHVFATIATTCRNPVKQCLIVQNPASVPISTVSKGNFLHQPTTNYSKCFDTQFHPAGKKNHDLVIQKKKFPKITGEVYGPTSLPPKKKWSWFQTILQPNGSTKNRLSCGTSGSVFVCPTCRGRAAASWLQLRP